LACFNVETLQYPWIAILLSPACHAVKLRLSMRVTTENVKPFQQCDKKRRLLPNFSVTRPNVSARLAASKARLAAADASLAVERARTEKRLPHRTVHGRDQQ
jgi:hypothetical protein